MNPVSRTGCDGTPLRAVTSKPVLRASQRLMRDAYCQAMFVDSFFHADCHGGNLLYIGDADAQDEASASEGEVSHRGLKPCGRYTPSGLRSLGATLR